jgi:hypothetical protein
MTSKFQIFISSTFADLTEERSLVIKAVLEMGHIPVGMEMFSAADDEQWNIITNQIDSSDYYVVIAAHKYGSTLPDGTSYTEKEYDYAVSKGLPVLGFVLDSSVEWPKNRSEATAEATAKLDAFKGKIKTKLISYWKTRDDLYGKCAISLMKAFTAYPREGWVRASEAQDVGASKELARLSAENAALRKSLAAHEAENAVDAEYAKLSQVLSKNVRNISVWLKDGAGWEPTKPKTLYRIFELSAPSLRQRADVVEISALVGTLVCNFMRIKLRKKWQTPSNTVRQILSAFMAYGLLEAVFDVGDGTETDEKYVLTARGAEYLAYMQRRRLEFNAAQATAPKVATQHNPESGDEQGGDEQGGDEQGGDEQGGDEQGGEAHVAA